MDCPPPGKESTCNVGDTGDEGLIPGSGRFPGDRKWQPTPVFSLEKSDGQMSLEGYSPKGRKESDTTKQLSTHTQDRSDPSQFSAVLVTRMGCWLKCAFLKEKEHGSCRPNLGIWPDSDLTANVRQGGWVLRNDSLQSHITMSSHYREEWCFWATELILREAVGHGDWTQMLQCWPPGSLLSSTTY